MHDELNKYIEKCMPSKEMQEYLKTYSDVDGLYLYHIIDMIVCSPVCNIYDKLKYLKELKPITDEIFDDNYDVDISRKDRYYEHISYLEYCINSLSKNGIFTAEEFWYDDDINAQDEYLCGLFANISDVNNFIDDYFNDLDDDDLRWIKVTQWIYDDNDYKPNVSFIFIKGNIIYCEIEDYGEEKIGIDGSSMLYYAENINLPVPFKAGDIVEISGYPFYKNYLCIILSVGDNIDCCSLQGAVKDFNNDWNIGALKHSSLIRFSGSKDYQISPLYSIKTFTGDIPENLKILSKIQAYINNDEEKGFKLSWKIYNCYSDKEIEDILN